MPMQDSTELRPPRPQAQRGWLVLLVLVLAAGGFGWYWWNQRQTPEPVAAVTPTSAPQAPPAAVAAPAEPSEPTHPMEATEDASAALPPLASSDAEVGKALNALLGVGRVGAFLQIDGFVRRVVATVDNLGRPQASTRTWPVHPTQGRFTVQATGDAEQIAAANAARYDAFVGFAESVPVEGAAALYQRLYPLFQAAYEELGFPGKYFNDRLVAVIDSLLAAPEPQQAVAVHLVHVSGEVRSLRPWVRYEFVDPALQAMPAGQKIMVRVGLKNERRLKAVLSRVRARIARAPAGKP